MGLTSLCPNWELTFGLTPPDEAVPDSDEIQQSVSVSADSSQQDGLQVIPGQQHFTCRAVSASDISFNHCI